MQKGARRADATAAAHIALHVVEPLLPCAVIVGVQWDPDFCGTRDEGIGKWVPVGQRLDRHCPVATAKGIVSIAHPLLATLEIGQHVRIAPAAVAELRPEIVVHALAAIVDHAVDRT